MEKPFLDVREDTGRLLKASQWQTSIPKDVSSASLMEDTKKRYLLK